MPCTDSPKQTHLGHVGDAEHEADRIEDVGLARVIVMVLKDGSQSTDGIGFEP